MPYEESVHNMNTDLITANFNLKHSLMQSVFTEIYLKNVMLYSNGVKYFPNASFVILHAPLVQIFIYCK
jgi:hypothetical protein